MLTLIVPGLIWPPQALDDLTHDLTTPALSRLLGRGRVLPFSAHDTHACLADAFDLALPLPAAALRRLVLAGINPGPSLCLDPIHLRFEQRTLMVDDPVKLNLNPQEAASLVLSLAPVFAALGDLELLSPRYWNLKLREPAPVFQSLAEIVGRSGALLPRDAVFVPWVLAINEAQMVLHAHPVNQARESAGLPVVNSVCPWGGGSLGTVPNGVASCQTNALWADDVTVMGLAQWLKLTCAPLPFAYSKAVGKSALVVFDRFEASARNGDGHAWRTQLQGFESEWLQPISAALLRRQLDAVRLVFPDHLNSIEVLVRASDMWKLWRKSVSLPASLKARLLGARASRPLF